MKHLFKPMLLLLIFFQANYLKAQEIPQYTEVNVIPPSPNVASLNKFIDVPVSHYTGIPNISVPIYTIDLPQLQLPISLNYHAGGLRVEEHASWIGAGWSLSAGGSVSRTVRGLPDEADVAFKRGWFTSEASGLFNSSGHIQMDSILSCYAPNYSVGASWGGAAIIRADTLAKGWIDSEPDVYHYSLPYGGGKFIFTRDRNIYKLDTDNFSITEHPFQSSILPNYPNESDYSWTIKGPDGVTYTFEKVEKTKVTSHCEGDVDSPYDGPNGLDYYQSAWLLTRMSLNGDTITFEYESDGLSYDQRLSSTQNFKIPGGGGGSAPTGSHCYNNTLVTSYRLSKITASNGVTVDFIEQETGTRSDLSGSKRLTRIEIKKGSQYIRGYKLDTESYFATDNKLKLRAVTPVDENDIAEAGYSFDYYDEGLVPDVDSRGQDYWGFNNGSSSTGSLIPEYKDDSFHFNENGVNRNPSLIHTRAGTLHKLNYPTGGYTEFEYELHSRYNADKKETFIQSIEAIGSSSVPDEQYSPVFLVGQNCSVTLDDEVSLDGENRYTYLEDNLGNIVDLADVLGGNRKSLPAGSYKLHAYNSEDATTAKITIEYEQPDPGEEYVGGLRVSKVSNTEGNEKTFSYVDTNGVSTGVLYAPPSFIGTIQTNHPDGETPFSWLSLSDKSQIPGITYQGSHIGYSRVIEADQLTSGHQNGMTIYEFVNQSSTIHNAFPIVPARDLSYKNGKIRKQSIYSTSVFEKDTLILGEPATVDSVVNRLIKLTEYNYNEHTLGSSIRAYKVGKVATRCCFSCLVNNDFKVSEYNYQRKWYALSSVEETSYEDSGQLTTTMSYEYDSPNHTFPTAQTQSFGDYSHKNTFTRDGNHPALIRTYAKYLLSAAPDKQLSGTEVTYHGKLPLTVKRWDWEDDVYHLEAQFVYDGNRVITRKTFSGNAASSGDEVEENYLWGYDNTLIVGVVNNATHSEINGELSAGDKTNLQSGVNVASIIGSLRTALSGAHVRTFVWRFGYGIEEEIDANGLKKSYTYDGFGRLTEVSENDKILAKYQYQYISQQ